MEKGINKEKAFLLNNTNIEQHNHFLCKNESDFVTKSFIF